VKPTSEAIPKDVALKLCGEIRSENAKKTFSAGKHQCNFCYKRAGNKPELLSIFTNPLNRGCSQVNDRYSKMKK
jgi:hypothetical protein